MIIAKFCWLCVDCLFASVTREAFNGARGPKAPPYTIGSVKRVQEVETAVAALGPDAVPDYSPQGEGYAVFSKIECDCCHAPTWGERFRFAVMEAEQEEAIPILDTDIDELLSKGA
jgi:hypothetical protein